MTGSEVETQRGTRQSPWWDVTRNTSKTVTSWP